MPAHFMLWEQFTGPSIKAMRTLFIKPLQGYGNTACLSYPDTWVRKPDCLHLSYMRSVSLPSYSSLLSHMRMWDCSICQPLSCCMFWSWPPWLPVSTPPASLDECFFFNSLIVRLPYSSMFCIAVLVVFCFQICCPSFTCARKQNLSAYTSILARSVCLFLITFS